MTLALDVELDERPCEVTFKGYAPSFIGLYQVNFRVRDEPYQNSSLNLRLRMNNALSPSTLLPVEP
jgi:uncharacterized protein (TIGR03437 family)